MHKTIRFYSLLWLLLISTSSYGLDIGVVNSTALGSINCSGTYSNLSADIENFGLQQIDSFYIYINVNGTLLDSMPIIQVIPSGQIINLDLGSFSLTNQLSNNVIVSTGLPNGNTDVQPANDGYSFNTYSRLNGVYSVGCLTCDFTSVFDATNHLNDYGVCGPTTLNIEDGVHNVSGIEINSYTGMSSANPVVIQSLSQDSTAVSLAIFSSPSIDLNSVEYLTFRKIEIEPQAGSIIFKLNSVSNFSIENCVILGGEIQTGYNGGGPSFHDVRISNNVFGLGCSIMFDNNGAQPDNSNGIVEILNNKFNDGWVEFDHFGQVLFNNNEVNSPNIDNPVRFLGCENGLITRNNLIGSEEIGVFSNGCSSMNISNNFLRSNGEVLSILSSSDINVINNNFYQYNALDIFGEAIGIKNSTQIEFVNNIVQSEEFGPLVYCTDTSWWHPHHNIYYSPSDSLVRFGLGDHITYEDWTVTYGKDSSSWNWNPNYVDQYDLHLDNLVIANGNAFAFPGILVDFDDEPRGVVAFDIGADEFDLDYATLRDISLISIEEPNNYTCSQADSIKLNVANYSTFQIDSFALSHYSYGIDNDVIWNYTTLPPGDTVLVNFGAYNFSPNTNYVLDYFLVLPNGNADNYELNNGGSITYQYLGEPNVSVRIVSDCSPEYELTVPNQVYDSLQWSTNEITDKITVSPPGSWSVTIMDQIGCSVSKTITLN
ncbi:MAG: right-handed parallel beta-helix repeat-containing protein [Crocinitomicaceae bacterium]|nr:right-handed parallel beta-helix repeat-containing protein [Crocinitomicaceae bacterium]